MDSATSSVAATKVANTATYGGSGSAVFFGLAANEFAAVGGVLVAVFGLLLNWWYKHQHLKLAQKKLDNESKEDSLD